MNLRLALIPLIAALGIVGCQGNSNPVMDFTVTSLKTGTDVKLSTEYSGKPIVVYLWATWCGPCKEFAPTLNQLAERYKTKGIEFLAISGESKKVVSEAEAKSPHNMNVMLDPIGAATEAVGSNSLPTIVVLDKGHQMVWGSKGIGPTTETEMITALDGLS